MSVKLFKCPYCGNIVFSVKDSGKSLYCCKQKMERVSPGMIDASAEKHVPVVEIKDGKILAKVGAVEHPMNEDHYIEWIAVETTKSTRQILLKPGTKPEAVFYLDDGDTFKAAWAYCNIHSIWKSDK